MTRRERKKAAEKHYKLMKEKYTKEIENSRVNFYDDNCNWKYPEEGDKFSVSVLPLDTVSALKMHKRGKTAILNFASYKNPGGGFLKGSLAQEEALCMESTLYNVLEKRDYFFLSNKKDTNKGLYRNRALYLEDIIFTNSKSEAILSADVISCAAPNYAAASEFSHVTKEENTEALKSRIRFVLDIAEHNHVETLILGAFGCGVFGQDGTEVANIFKETLAHNNYSFSHVYFAIPKGPNFCKFSDVFETTE